MRRAFAFALLLLFLAHQAAATAGVAPAWADAWLDDLLFLPLVLAGIRVLRGRVVPTPQIAGAVVYAALVFELLLPHLSSRFTADPLDVAAYALGALVYHRLIEHPRPVAAVA